MVNVPENLYLPAYIFNSRTIVAVVFQANGKLLQTNALFNSAFGVSDKGVSKRYFPEFVSPQDKPLFENAVKQCLETEGDTVAVRLRAVHTGGSCTGSFSWEFSKLPARGAEGSKILALGTGLAEGSLAQANSGSKEAPLGPGHITAHSAADRSCLPDYTSYETALQEEKRFSETLVSSLPDLVFLFDGQGRCLDVRGSTQNLLLPESEVLGRRLSEMMPADTAALLFNLIKGALEGNTASAAEYTFTLKGEVYYFESRCVKFDENRVMMLVRDISSRIKAEIERDNLLAEYEVLFDSNHLAIFLISVENEGRFVYMRTNKTHVETTGLTPEVLWNKSPEEVFGESFGSEISKNYQKCIRKGDTLIYEEELELPAGRKNWLTALKPVRINGRIVFIIGSAADITELKQNEKVLLKQKEQLEQISEVSRVGGFEYFPKEERLFWTRMTKKIHAMPENYQPDIAAAFSFFTKPEHRNKIEAAASEAILQGKPYDLELQITDGDGTEKWIRAIGTTAFENGECVRLYGTFQDIDAQKRLERLSRANEQRYMNILQAAPNGMVVITDMKIDYINPSGLVLLGAGRMADVVGKYVKELVHPDDYLLGSLKIIDMINGKPVKFPHELRLIKNDGSFIDAEITAAFLPSVETPALLVIFSDITERKNNRRAIEEQNRVLRQIAWEQSHVVRGPVSRLMCLADAIETADFQIISQKEMLDGIVQSAQELDDIIRDISDKANRLLHPEAF